MSCISDVELYKRLTETAALAEQWQVGYPSERVSRRYFDWLEFVVRGFWEYLTQLASLSGDTTVYFYDLQRAKNTEFDLYAIFGLFPVVELSVEMTGREYLSALNCEPGHSEHLTYIPAYTDEYLILPPSGKWHIHGAYEIEMAELVSYVGLPAPEVFPHDFWSEEEALRRIHLLK
ncbi:hypothetical protein AKI39_14670 [Bordetella sp. H567]|uniref:hypothetical protein n=1 Tax=Bordetella sp. H567 TaxID=1697043 RepID=UPI00081C3EC7|nr:hypothetical protein [Bordetella sp. H567]AOB31668.1 hypothetical protein AKI39_14670 [Bordetella sp. H567]